MEICTDIGKMETDFETLFVHAKIVNTYSSKIIEDGSVGIKNGKIVSVCPQSEYTAKEIVDCGGRYMAPSFIDAHMHIESSRLNPSAYARAAVPHGCGCIMTDPMQLVNTMGEKGLLAIQKMLENIPFRAFIQFPSRVPAAEGLEHSGAYFTAEDTVRLIRKTGALTLGEVNCYDLSKESTVRKVEYARSAGKMVNGHCPGVNRDGLMYAAAIGIDDDHECEKFEELIDRLDAGMSVMIREGTIEHNCQELVRGLVKHQVNSPELMFCTDDKSPEDILQNGCIDNCVRIAINEGVDPVAAIQMATINPAKHFHLERMIGVIAPGRYADFVLFRDLHNIVIDTVFWNGHKVAEAGNPLFDYEMPSGDILRNTINLPTDLTEEDLYPQTFSGAMELLPNSLMTRRIAGCTVPDFENDILPIAVIDRYSGQKHVGCALIRGLDIKRGAVASSCGQEGNNIVVSGTNGHDMLCAVKEIQRIGGGHVVCIDGKITGVKRLPIGGILSDQDILQEINSNKDFGKAMMDTGSSNKNLIATLIVSLCPSIPYIGLTDMGIIENGRLVS